MSADRAFKLAVSLLASNKCSEAFEVEVMTRDETNAVAAALRRLGCRVDIDPFKPRLTIIRPHGA